MKRKILALSLIAVMAISMAACGKEKDDDNYIEINKKGVISEVAREDFGASYYSEDELKEFVETEVADFNGEKGKDVTVEDLEVKDGIASLTLKYKDSDVYSKFNKVDCYYGTILSAQTAGYDFNTEFTKVDDGKKNKGKKKKQDELSGEDDQVVTRTDVLNDDDLKVFIVQTDFDIVIPGKVVYMSAYGTSLVGDNHVHVDEKKDPREAKDIIYVLYK